jgi:hypothetical protein
MPTRIPVDLQLGQIEIVAHAEASRLNAAADHPPSTRSPSRSAGLKSTASNFAGKKSPGHARRTVAQYRLANR